MFIRTHIGMTGPLTALQLLMGVSRCTEYRQGPGAKTGPGTRLRIQQYVVAPSCFSWGNLDGQNIDRDQEANENRIQGSSSTLVIDIVSTFSLALSLGARSTFPFNSLFASLSLFLFYFSLSLFVSFSCNFPFLSLSHFPLILTYSLCLTLL